MSTLTALSLDDVLTLPETDLLSAAHAKVIASEAFADEPHFFGAVVRRTDDRVFLVLPADRDEAERDCALRGLVAALLRLDTSSWPPCMQFSDSFGDDR